MIIFLFFDLTGSQAYLKKYGVVSRGRSLLESKLFLSSFLPDSCSKSKGSCDEAAICFKIGVAAPYNLLLLACQDEISSDVFCDAATRLGGVRKKARPLVLEWKPLTSYFFVFARRRSAAVYECYNASGQVPTSLCE